MRHLPVLALVAPLVICAAIGCGEAESPHRATGERLWREAVWNMGQRSFAEAIPHLEQAMVSAEGDPGRELVFLMGSAYLFNGQSGAAMEYVDALRYGPPAPEPMLLDGWELALAHARPDAELAFGHCLDRTVAEHPFAAELNYLSLFWRGEERFFHGNWEGAAQDLHAANSMLRERGAVPNRRLVRMLAEAHRIVGRSEAAEIVLRDAATSDPSHAPFAYELGLALAAQAKSDEARQWFLTAAECDARFPAPHIKLAGIAWASGDLAAMRTHLDTYATLTNADAMIGRDPRANAAAAEIASATGLYWTERAKLHAAEGDEDQAAISYGLARDAYARALELNPGCHQALKRLIQLGAHSGETPETIDGWKRALDEIERRDGSVPDEPLGADGRRTFC